MTNSVSGRIFDTIMKFLNMFRFWVVLNVYEKGIILRLGEFHKVVGPGIHWRLPFNIDTLCWQNVRQQTTDSWEMSLTCKDGVNLTVSFDMVFEVFDVEKVILTVHEWQKVAYTTGKIVLAQIIESKRYQETLHSTFTEEVRNALNVILAPMGINVVRIGITDKVRTKAYRFFTGANS